MSVKNDYLCYAVEALNPRSPFARIYYTCTPQVSKCVYPVPAQTIDHLPYRSRSPLFAVLASSFFKSAT
jgi:hypothetical protein